MIAVSKSAGATLANGALSLWVQSTETGLLTDVYAAALQILDADGTSVVAKTALTVGTATPTGSHAGLGHYTGVWTPGAAAVGKYSARWFYQLTATSAEISFDQEIELVAKPYADRNYCSVYDLRAEGLTESVLSDAQAQTAIVRASKYIEFLTGRQFSATRKVVTLDGTSARAVMVNEPIVAIEEILVSIVSNFGTSDLAMQTDALRVYNRHLTQNLTDPDDRANPRLEFVHGDDLGGVNYGKQTGPFMDSLIWPRGRQNVKVTGLFGYTEADGSFIGATPFLIRQAAMMLVFRNADKMNVRAGRPDGSRILSELTRDQSVTYGPVLTGGTGGTMVFTGDFEIDSILVGFKRPPHFGSA